MGNTENNNIKTVDDVMKFALNLIDEEDAKSNFQKYFNTRDFEMKITEFVKILTLDDSGITTIENEMQKNKKSNKPYAFVLFFVLFSWMRRNHYRSLQDLYDDYATEFKDYEILAHIHGMLLINTGAQHKEIKKAIDSVGKLIENKSDNHDFSTHVGVLNLYTELVCQYFEGNLEERNSDASGELLGNALKYITKAIKQDESKENSAYPKFYLNKGRILILNKKYEEGERYIREAISKIPLSNDRIYTVNDYSQYLIKSSMTKAYDTNAEKHEELDKLKEGNFKAVSLIMAVVGFLLGAINIFTEVKDTFTLLLLMVGYGGLMIMLAGIALFAFTLTVKKRNNKSLIYDGALIIAGIGVFLIPLIIIVT